MARVMLAEAGIIIGRISEISGSNALIMGKLVQAGLTGVTGDAGETLSRFEACGTSCRREIVSRRIKM